MNARCERRLDDFNGACANNRSCGSTGRSGTRHSTRPYCKVYSVLLGAALSAFCGQAQAQTLESATISVGGGVLPDGSIIIIGQPFAGTTMSSAQFTIEVGAIALFVPSAAAPPREAAYPHDRRKNRYISFDPGKAGNDGTNIAFKVTLTAITLGSCNGPAGDPPQVDFCRADRGADDCNTCVGAAAENSCIAQLIDCSAGGACTSTGELCVNDAPNTGGSNVGRVWWVGPEKNGVHLLVSQPFRAESTNWANPVHVGDCEVVPEAVYGIRAVNVASGSESAELLVETTLFAASSASWWGDCVGPITKFCGGDIRTPACATDADCPPGLTCDRAWTLPDGATNFDDVNAALALVAPGPTSVAPDPTWVDLHGNATGTPGSQNFDPPNFVLNFSDIGQIISGFGGFPYKGYDPADCPDVGAWP